MRIIVKGKPHCIGENVLLSAVKDVKIMTYKKFVKDIDLIPLSDDMSVAE